MLGYRSRGEGKTGICKRRCPRFGDEGNLFSLLQLGEEKIGFVDAAVLKIARERGMYLVVGEKLFGFSRVFGSDQLP